MSISKAVVLTVLSTAVLVGCNTTRPMDIPHVPRTTSTASLEPFGRKATFALSKVIANIRRGSPIIHFPATDLGTNGTLCNYGHSGESTLNWGGGSSMLGNWSTELGELFYETLSQKGFNIAGDPKDLFGKQQSVASAEFLIGARITEIKGNICENHHWWDGRPLGEYSGEVFLKVEWIVFSTLTQQDVFRVNTEGYKFEKEPRKDGIILLFQEAFSDAAEKFASNPQTVNIALRKTSGDAVQTSSSSPTLLLKGSKVSNLDLQKQLDDILANVVTIRVGMGHGSGFIVSHDGYVLTNSHVVGNSSKVAVRFSNGIETTGDVIRKNDGRDTAVVKVPLRTKSPLPIRPRATKRLDVVFAVGSPLSESLESTITKGVVSAMRKDPASGLTFIQADVPISPGNSGGPLLDERGGVVGMSVAKFTGRGAEGLSLFIPIDEVLKSLSIKLGSGRSSLELRTSEIPS